MYFLIDGASIASPSAKDISDTTSVSAKSISVPDVSAPVMSSPAVISTTVGERRDDGGHAMTLVLAMSITRSFAMISSLSCG